MLDYHLSVFVAHQFHHSSSVHVYKTILMKSLLIWPIVICAMHATLFSNNIVGSLLIEESPNGSWIYWIIDLSHIHSWLASWIVSIFEWFDDVAIIICLTDLHEIAMPLQLNIYPVCDLPLCGSERYPASIYPSNYYLIHLSKIDPHQ